MSRLALMCNVRVGDTVTVEMWRSTLIYPNVQTVRRYKVRDVQVVDIVDETGDTFTADAFRAVRVDSPDWPTESEAV